MEKKEKRTFKQFFMDNNKRNLKITITVVCVVLALAIIGGGIYIGNKLGLITIDHGGTAIRMAPLRPRSNLRLCMMSATLRASTAL